MPDPALLRCLTAATTSGSAYDAGSDHTVELTDGHEVMLYERRGPLPAKPTAAPVRSGVRDVSGESWRWAELADGTTVLSTMTRGTYVELSMRGDASPVDELARIAATLRPVGTLPRLRARELCAALPYPGVTSVAAAFDSTAATMAKWEETPEYPGRPHEVSSDWRKAPLDEIVTLCYLDGHFGPAHGPAPLASSATPRPDYDRIVLQIALDRRPIARLFGWRDTIAIRDPSK
ncbi:MAG: hypothetical protein KGK07_14155 [Chloroflexota bacterium]|nr:hypothetical protein [Chloroflexota bacterium]